MQPPTMPHPGAAGTRVDAGLGLITVSPLCLPLVPTVLKVPRPLGFRPWPVFTVCSANGGRQGRKVPGGSS